jgi:hypothetical protein
MFLILIGYLSYNHWNEDTDGASFLEPLEDFAEDSLVTDLDLSERS